MSYFFFLMKSINLRFTKSINDVIGRENEFIWFLNKETSDFRETSKDQIVLMGKRTWETIPETLKQNLNYFTVIVTRDRNFTYFQDNVTVVYDLEWYINKYIEDQEENRQLWIIGGGSILSQAIKYADIVEVIEVNEKVVGDILAPKIDRRSFSLTNSSDLKIDSFTGVEYFKTTYKRISKSWLKRGSALVN